MDGVVGEAIRGQGAEVKIVWSRRAVGHLAALREYIAAESPAAAARTARRILDSVALLATQPQMGRPGRVPGTREWVVPRTPYIVPYRVRGARLELIAVFHGKQKWPSMM